MVRRVSGKPLKHFVAEEIAGLLGADFQIGAAEADWERIADVVPPPLPLDFDASRTGGRSGQTAASAMSRGRAVALNGLGRLQAFGRTGLAFPPIKRFLAALSGVA